MLPTVSKFATGFTWFYWPHFRDGGKMAQLPGNQNDLDGYPEDQLYVKCKYPTYKDEILSHLGINQYNEIMIKAEEYLKTNRVRAMKPSAWAIDLLKYEISKGDPMKLDHIASVILYCDYSAYCTDFSSTFRKVSPTESTQDVKKRNSLFWWQSKLFREVVECYGICNDDEMLDDDREPESGPFFSGLDAVLAVPQFDLRLCAPTSTSKHLSVSLNFAKRSGMILQLNNDQDSHAVAQLSPFFNVSWISRFPDEDERVFCGLFSYNIYIYKHLIFGLPQIFC